ncbi:hypothetical protein H4O20_08670 [Aequorivita sp. 609]|uniref:hypothetical protein n=1 Tax=Aequorivita sp. 609 TaxID=2760087 RepID=UPI0016229F44|nr:hypothetical protein [Aequorivita sp. 609]MBB6681514.1 hypothetical protein [Aequorivita sp. 609]
MKTFTFYILTLFTTLVFAQKPTELNWTFNDFIENDLNKVSKYSIPLRKNGKIKRKDSTLLFSKEVDIDNKTVFGIKSNLVVVTHVGTHLTWNKFKNYYDKNGLIIKETMSPLEIEKTKEFGFIGYIESVGETIYEYDLNQNLKRLFNLGVKFHITAVCAALNSFLGVILLAITQLSTQQALKIAFPRNFIKFMKYGNLNPETEFKGKLV